MEKNHIKQRKVVISTKSLILIGTLCFCYAKTIPFSLAKQCSSLFEVLHRFQHCTGHITMGSLMGRGNQYIQLVKVIYCKQLTISKQLPTFPHMVQGLNHQPQRWEASVLPLRHHGPWYCGETQGHGFKW